MISTTEQVRHNVKVNNFGWECPKCHRIYSPTTTECYSCNGLEPIICKTEIDIEEVKKWTENNLEMKL